MADQNSRLSILSKPAIKLSEIADSAVLYLVSSLKDYTVTAQVFVDYVKKYINRTSLDIDKVDNTSDADKPVSTATSEALALKANKSEVVTSSQLDEVSQLIGEKVSYETYRGAIENILARLIIVEQTSHEGIMASVEAALAPVIASQELLIQQNTELSQQVADAQTKVSDVVSTVSEMSQLINEQNTIIAQLQTTIEEIQQRLDRAVVSGEHTW